MTSIFHVLLLFGGLHSALGDACSLPGLRVERNTLAWYNGFVLDPSREIGRSKRFSAAECALLCFNENRDACLSLSFNRLTSDCVLYDTSPVATSITESRGYRLVFLENMEDSTDLEEPPSPNACDANPCQNGGTCSEDCNPNHSICHCGEGWTGIHCEVPREINTAYSCGETTTDSSGSIESPNYPGPYPTDLNCEIKIKGSAGQTVWLNFDEFSVGDDVGSCTFTDCVLVNIYIGGTYQRNYKFYGINRPPVPFNTLAEDVVIKFTTTSTFNAGRVGFHATYEIR